MKALRMPAQRVLEKLAEGLVKVGDHKKINNAEGAFMAVSVELISQCALGGVFSVAQYYEQNGDLMRDPEMVFLRGLNGAFYPTYFRQDGGTTCFEEESADLAAGTFRLAVQAEHASFANTWMRNIKEQQHL